jgi:hypothetical protein
MRYLSSLSSTFQNINDFANHCTMIFDSNSDSAVHQAKQSLNLTADKRKEPAPGGALQVGGRGRRKKKNLDPVMYTKKDFAF